MRPRRAGQRSGRDQCSGLAAGRQLEGIGGAGTAVRVERLLQQQAQIMAVRVRVGVAAA